MLTMEAHSEKDAKRDSFEDVDRILAIVEESKAQYDTKGVVYTLAFTIVYSLLATGLCGAFLYNKDNLDAKFGSVALVLVAVAVLQGFSLHKKKKKAKDEFEQTRAQALEIIREVIPALSRSERWSTLRKFELRLRLSKLDISANKLFGQEFDQP